MVVLYHRGFQVVTKRIRCHPSNFSTKVLLPSLASLAFESINPHGQYRHKSCNYSTRTARYGDGNLMNSLSSIISTHHVNRPYHLQTAHIHSQIQTIQNPKQQKRSYSPTTKQCQSKLDNELEEETSSPTLIYEGPFASLSQRLKRISISTAIISIIGVPLLVTFHSGDVPASGQLAVGTTAIIAATGSTAALSYCFSPYVKTLSYINDVNDGGEDSDGNGDNDRGDSKTMIKATTTNIFAMEKTTIFNPDTDVSLPSKAKTYRPFCNFMVKDEPFYIHPQMLHDDELRVKLLGVEKGTLVKIDEDDGGSEEKKKKLKKDLDDDFL